MTRMPTVEESTLSPAQRRVWDEIVNGPRGEVAGPLKVWLQSAELADRAQALGAFARYGTSLPPHLSELAILITARLWSAEFEWNQHAPIALAAGIPPEVIDAIGQAEVPVLSDPQQAAVRDVAIALQRDRCVSDGVYRAALKALGQQGLVELVGILGYYGLISMTINAFEVPQDPGPPLPPLLIAAEQMFR